MRKGLPRISGAAPSESLDFSTMKSDDRNISLPPSISSCELKANRSRSQVGYFHSEFCDFFDGDIISGRYVEYIVGFTAVSSRSEYCVENIGYMNVALALGSVSQDPQPIRIGTQAAHEVEADAVRLTRSNNIREAKGARS